MSQDHQEPQGHAPAPFEPFTGKMTKTQAGILRTLWDLETGQGQLSNLRHGLHSSAAKLVERGLIWKKDRWPARPVYGITLAGLPAALEAWREVYPERAQAEIEARCQQQLPPGVRPIVEEALATDDLVKANEVLHRLSGGKTIGQVADDWAAQIQTPADPEQHEQRQQQPELPPPQLPAEEQTYSQRVWTAYRVLCDEMQAPDVPIHALHRRVGGSLLELQNHLRAECLGHRATPSTGEPAFAGDAAKQSALHLPGEKESFLLVKLLEPPATIQSAEIAAGVGIFDVAVPTMADSQKPRITISLTAEQARLLAEAIQHVSQQAEFQDLHRELQAFADRPHQYVQEHKPNELERYEQLLRATAKLRYPERTPELEARIEKAVQKRLGEFRQEQQLRAYEARLRRTVAEKHPTLTAKEAEYYERRIKELLASRREELARKQQPQQPARQQEQGRAIGR